MAFVDAALAVGSFIGADALGTTAATLIGGGIMGAAGGALFGGLTGGNVGKDALYGMGIGAGGAAVGSALGAGAAADGVVPGAVGAGPAPTAFGLSAPAGVSTASLYPSTAGLTGGSTFGSLVAPGAGASTFGSLAAPTVSSLEGAAGLSGSSLAASAASAAPASALASGFDAATSWMGEHPIMTGLGVLAGANMLGLNRPTQTQLPAGSSNTMNTGYYKLNPATFQPNRPPVTQNPVMPSYRNYVTDPYQGPGMASGGIAGYSDSNYKDIMDETNTMNQYEQMLTGRRAASQEAAPAWVDNPGIVQDTDPNTRDLSAYEAARYRAAKTYANAGAPTSAGIGIAPPVSNYGQVSTDPAMVRAAMAQQQQQVQGAAQGGIMGYSLGGYASGGNPRLLKGPGDGMSDNIPATIGDRQPARLADGEFVVPADVVSHLGNGSTDAGAKKLHSMMDKVREKRTGKKKQAPAVNPDKFIPE